MVPVRSRVGYVTSGTVSLCTVSGIEESGTVYINGSGNFSIEKLSLLFNTVLVRYGIVRYGTGTESERRYFGLIFYFSVYND